MLSWRSGSHPQRVLPQQVDEGAQLKPGDVGPAAALLHGLQQGEQLLTILRKALKEGTLLHVAIHYFKLPQQQEEIVGAVLVMIRERAEFLQQWCQPIVEGLLLLTVHRSSKRC